MDVTCWKKVRNIVRSIYDKKTEIGIKKINDQGMKNGC